MDNPLQKTRGVIANEGGSEIATLIEQPAAMDLFEQMQKLRNQKYVAIKAAIADASKPFDDKLNELEKEYALLLRLST